VFFPEPESICSAVFLQQLVIGFFWPYGQCGTCWELLNRPVAALLLPTPDVMQFLQDRKLQLYSFEGVKTREWVMDSIIR